jgi:hypothetical protein
MVPITVEMTVEITAMMSELRSAVVSAGMLNRSVYQCRVKPCQRRLSRPLVSLKPNTIMTRMGRLKYRIISQV